MKQHAEKSALCPLEIGRNWWLEGGSPLTSIDDLVDREGCFALKVRQVAWRRQTHQEMRYPNVISLYFAIVSFTRGRHTHRDDLESLTIICGRRTYIRTTTEYRFLHILFTLKFYLRCQVRDRFVPLTLRTTS